MKSAFEKIGNFFIDHFIDYLIDKAVGVFFSSIVVDIICFFYITQSSTYASPPQLAITILKVFQVLGAVSLITSLITIIPAFVKLYTGLVKWLTKILF